GAHAPPQEPLGVPGGGLRLPGRYAALRRLRPACPRRLPRGGDAPRRGGHAPGLPARRRGRVLPRRAAATRVGPAPRDPRRADRCGGGRSRARLSRRRGARARGTGARCTLRDDPGGGTLRPLREPRPVRRPRRRLALPERNHLMSERIQRLMAGVDIVRHGTIPVGIEKARNITASFRQTEGQPHIIRTAKAFAAVVEGATLFIEDDMLLVGNPASRPWGVELTPLWGTWPQEEIDGLEQAGYVLAPDVRTEIDELNEYWRGRCLTARMTDSYDDERLWPYAQMGVVLPPFRSKEEGWGAGGLLGGGYGVHMEISQMIGTPQYDKVLTRGIPALIADIEAQLRGVRRFRDADFERVYFYQAAIIALQGVQTLIRRFAEIARRDAESASPERRAELLEIAASCARVAEEPARSAEHT